MPRLGLTGWTFGVSMEHAITNRNGDEIHATISVNHSDGNHAYLSACRYLDTMPERQRESTILHELCHLLIWDAMEYALSKLNDDNWLKREIEMAVGNLTRVFMEMEYGTDQQTATH